MDIRDLRFFLELAETGNYLNAALNLGISQSTLSKRIIALEAELGKTLVDRSRRKISITEAGIEVQLHATRILSVYRKMLMALEGSGTVRAPLITILSIPVLAAYDIPSLLGRLGKAEPGVELRLVETEACDILPAILRGEAELGLIRGVFVDQSRFESVSLYDDEAIVVLPLGHPFSSAESLDLLQLQHERFILMDKQTLQLDFFSSLCVKSGFQPEIVHASTHADNILNMVSSGLGISLLPRRIAEFPKEPGISIVPLRTRTSMNIVMAWQRSAGNDLPLRLLLDGTSRFQLI